MNMKYHCPKCYSENTRRAIIIDNFDDLSVRGEPYNPKYHGNPFKCNDCNNVFVVGMDKIPYIEHCKLAGEENEY